MNYVRGKRTNSRPAVNRALSLSRRAALVDGGVPGSEPRPVPRSINPDFELSNYTSCYRCHGYRSDASFERCDSRSNCSADSCTRFGGWNGGSSRFSRRDSLHAASCGDSLYRAFDCLSWTIGSNNNKFHANPEQLGFVSVPDVACTRFG